MDGSLNAGSGSVQARAWLVRRGVWAAAGAPGPGAAGPVLDLLQGIGLLAPSRAHALLRGPIGLSAPPSARELAAIRTLGRRFRVGEPPEVGPRIDVGPAARWLRRTAPVWVGAASILHDPTDVAVWSALVARLARRASGRAIAAVLVDAEGSLRAAAVHRTWGRRSDHAELLLCQRWWQVHGRPFPAPAWMYVSREPCAMCAHALVASRTRELAVWFAEAEPGPSARGSPLRMTQPCHPTGGCGGPRGAWVIV